MLKVNTLIVNRWGRGTIFLPVFFVCFACSEGRQQTVSCESIAGAPTDELSTPDYEVEHQAYNSTFLRADVANLYAIDQDEKLGVVMVSVYEKDGLGVGVEACVKGEVKNLIGQENRLEFDEIREGEAIYHISTFVVSREEHLTFKVDVGIVATGMTHNLKWQQQF